MSHDKPFNPGCNISQPKRLGTGQKSCAEAAAEGMRRNAEHHHQQRLMKEAKERQKQMDRERRETFQRLLRPDQLT